ncbi:hypothetical protein CDD80_3375 [Ophiocordyceps camponoti-rufipedis]|uniref:Uncharacterized protein n=1 Tax=Ophiocordyceps camponoti-rufipedis TaxID=2004952 RepID=A0A2C5ZJ87_9HYPO|nr:hypothetical protein CDD80_3375 [Ophiocordyceps camponoti-rufipedis]
MSNKRRKSSSGSLHPPHAHRITEKVDDFSTFCEELKTEVGNMLPTTGRRFEQAAILAINYSETDIPGVTEMRDKLLETFARNYNWRTEIHEINSKQTWVQAEDALTLAIAVRPFNHHLVILDCSAGLANLEQTDVEVLGASAWESEASFTHALIEAIEHAHVTIKVQLAKSETLPSVREWTHWLKSNLPSYIGHIDIRATWSTGSSTVFVVLPIEVWLALRDREGLEFVCYDFNWNVRHCRRRQEAILGNTGPEPEPRGSLSPGKRPRLF